MALLLDIFFGAIGSAYFLYGRREVRASFLIAGVLLVIFPYFVSGTLLTLVIGAFFSAGPFLLARLEL